MPRFVLAVKKDKPRKKYVRTSINHIKTELKQHPGTEWSIAHYDVKTDLKNLCVLLEDIYSVEVEEHYDMKVSPSGQCRKV